MSAFSLPPPRRGFAPLPNADSPYPSPHSSRPSSISGLSEKYTLLHDPLLWETNLSPNILEDDDYIHDPRDVDSANMFRSILSVSRRGLMNMGCLILLIIGILALFIATPVVVTVLSRNSADPAGFSLNGTGQIPDMPGNFGLIDKDTPQDALTKVSWMDGSPMQLVFSDEFNEDGRTFYPGDDPYWEAVDLYYWATNNLEWYDPAAVTTEGGSLVIQLSRKQTHGLNYQGGMVSTWNKFCFTGGYFEVGVQLPGSNDITGFWPAIWSMGNLGRAGYGASLEGMWPYTYDACDVGTVANQSVNGVPAAAAVNGDPSRDGALSYLPGQKLSRCTCQGEIHPGPKHRDGTFVGRAAPEIDVFEAQISAQLGQGEVSQSAQWAPFNAAYAWQNTSDNMIIYDTSVSAYNTFVGTATQQATSVVSLTDQTCYENDGACFSVYGFEYKPGFDTGYISWVSNNQLSWTLNAPGMGSDPEAKISARPVPQEPMYLLANLGMSFGFGEVDLANLPFPAHMRVDYVRVYQPKGSINIGCDPKDFPTQAYINQHIEAYTNPNLTTWRGDYGQPFPKNSFLGEC